jgi:Holliday junction resolvase RusA-like endonuclease
MIQFHINPRGKPRPRVVRRGNKSITYSPSWYSEWCKELQAEALVHDYQVPDILADITFVIQMPKSWTKKKKLELDGMPHTQKPDLDNILKGFKDALCENDSYVHSYNNIRKIWGYMGKIIINDETG